MNRMYSVLEVKAYDDEKRTIKGIATTPTADRVGDIVEPLGVKFTNPMPLLWQHRHSEPVGSVTFKKPTKDGIEFEATIASLDTEGTLKSRLDEAWQSVKIGLVRAVSIGFRYLEYAFLDEGGIHFLKTEVIELSLVTIPANPDAVISSIKSMDPATIKSIDAEVLAASGKEPSDEDRPKPPGVSGKRHSITLRPKEGTNMKTIAEQIAALEAVRKDKAEKMAEIANKASEEGRSFTAEEQSQFDDLAAEADPIEADVKRLKQLEALQKASLKAVDPVVTAAAGSDVRDPNTAARSAIVLKKELPKGTVFTRYVAALAAERGDRRAAAEMAKALWSESTPEVESILRMPTHLIEKVAVNPGTTTDTTWAAPLVQYQNMASEFIDYLRPLTIMGRLSGFRNVPFKIKVPRQTAGASVNWVGEGKVKPLTSLAFDSLTLEHSKIAGIIPLSEELVRFSSPSAEELVRADLSAAIAQFIDVEFIDPTNAATDVSPASVTYGVSPITATGTTADAFRTDVKSMFAALLVANQQISSGYWVMTQQQALGFSLMQNALGQNEFPGISMGGGTLLGFPVVTSENIPATAGSPADGYPIIFVMPGEILLADDGGVSIDMSREASLQMETTPDSPWTASTVTVNLWQHNMVAIKAERFINWKARRTTAAALIAGAKYA